MSFDFSKMGSDLLILKRNVNNGKQVWRMIRTKESKLNIPGEKSDGLTGSDRSICRNQDRITGDYLFFVKKECFESNLSEEVLDRAQVFPVTEDVRDHLLCI